MQSTSWCSEPWHRWHCVHSALNCASKSFTATTDRWYSSPTCGGVRDQTGGGAVSQLVGQPGHPSHSTASLIARALPLTNLAWTPTAALSTPQPSPPHPALSAPLSHLLAAVLAHGGLLLGQRRAAAEAGEPLLGKLHDPARVGRGGGDHDGARVGACRAARAAGVAQRESTCAGLSMGARPDCCLLASAPPCQLQLPLAAHPCSQPARHRSPSINCPPHLLAPAHL